MSSSAAPLTFLQWCSEQLNVNFATNVPLAHRWIAEALADETMPWNGSCQAIYEYMLNKGSSEEQIEGFLFAWELSGRAVEIDDDYSSDTCDDSRCDEAQHYPPEEDRRPLDFDEDEEDSEVEDSDASLHSF